MGTLLAIGLFTALSCAKDGEIQIGNIKLPVSSLKQAHESLWDFYLEPSKKASQELLLAVKAGNRRLVKDFLSESHDSGSPIYLSTEVKDEKGWTPLMWAVHYNHADVVQELIKEDANVDARGEDGTTPLALAVRNNHPEIFAALLRESKAVDTPDQEGNTPLMLAVTNNQLEFVEELVRKEASPSMRNAKGLSALQIADERGNWQALKLLLGESSWREVATSEAGDRYDLNPLTVRPAEGRSVVAWLKEYRAKPPANPGQAAEKAEMSEASYTLSQVKVQCRAHRFQILQRWHAGLKGKNREEKKDGTWQDIFPETVGESIVSEVCEMGF